LIHALRFLNDKDSIWIKRLGVVFIGDYQQQEKDEMLQLIAQAPIKIEVTGYHTNIGPELNRLHLLLIPSIAEPFGRVVQEAAEAGVPVIASDNGGLGEVCKKFHYGALFRYPDITYLSRLIEQTIENYNRVLAESHKNREAFLAEFPFEKNINEIEEVLLNACEYHQ
jgi:glycosyltransferase involved in cell wall biosynthesis